MGGTACEPARLRTRPGSATMRAMRAGGPAETVKRIYDAFGRGDLDTVVALVHPDSLFQSYAVGGGVLHGPAEVRTAFEKALTSIYRVVFEVLEDLDTTTALASGTARFTPPGSSGHQITRTAWLWTVEDGLATTATIFPTEDAARDAWASGDWLGWTAAER